jgi:hypothetical protein
MALGENNRKRVLKMCCLAQETRKRSEAATRSPKPYERENTNARDEQERNEEIESAICGKGPGA